MSSMIKPFLQTRSTILLTPPGTPAICRYDVGTNGKAWTFLIGERTAVLVTLTINPGGTSSTPSQSKSNTPVPRTCIFSYCFHHFLTASMYGLILVATQYSQTGSSKITSCSMLFLLT